ncbi:MAG TPA: hypothetical protein VGR02_03180 [Thermoanaerobaculia bacterium]|nr:hypothetical protein [Thermoanaerobaculia bacterium]
MNLYVVLAIALGAISGVTQPPAARSGRSAVVAADVRAIERQPDATETHAAKTSEPRVARTPAKRTVKTTPLAGAATPRAPATTR